MITYTWALYGEKVFFPLTNDLVIKNSHHRETGRCSEAELCCHAHPPPHIAILERFSFIFTKKKNHFQDHFAAHQKKIAEKAKVPKKVDCEPSTLPLLYCQKYIGAIITIKVLNFWGNVSHHWSWKLEIDYVCIIFSTSFSFSLSISNRVVACYDDVKKGACRRQDCKFFHPPNHLKVFSPSTLMLTWIHSF